MPSNKLDRILGKASQQDLAKDIKDTINLIAVPDDYNNYLLDNLQCHPNTPVEAHLWLLIKKQEHLIKRLDQSVQESKKQVEVLQKNIAETQTAKKELEKSVDSQKYIIKCLHEKNATLEEQVEILTAVEAR